MSEIVPSPGAWCCSLKMSRSLRSKWTMLCEPQGPGSSPPAMLKPALYTTEHPDLSAAVIDLRLGDGNGAVVCRRLRHLGIPFVVHTGYPRMLVESEWPDVPVISKPAPPGQIVATLAGLLH